MSDGYCVVMGTSLGLRLVPPSERAPQDVPFNILAAEELWASVSASAFVSVSQESQTKKP